MAYGTPDWSADPMGLRGGNPQPPGIDVPDQPAMENGLQFPSQPGPFGIPGDWLDNLAASLGNVRLPMPRTPSQGFASGLAEGFVGARGRQMAQQEALNWQQQQFAAQRNAANLRATEAARALRMHGIQKKQDLADEAAAKLQSQPKLSAELAPFAPGYKVGDSLPEPIYNAAAEAYNRVKNPPPKTDPNQNSDVVISPSAQKIADQIHAGKMRPDMLSKLNPRGDFRNQVATALANYGDDINQMEQNIHAETSFWSGQNSAVMQKQRNNARMVMSSLDKVQQYDDRLSKLVNRTEVPEINSATLAVLTRKPGEAGRVARLLQRQISDVVPEMGGVYMGGNAVTDEALKLASQNLAGNWSHQVMRDAVDQGRQNVGMRLQSMDQATPREPGSQDIDNAYDALSTQGMRTVGDFDAAMGHRRSDGKTLLDDLNAKGLSGAQIAKIRARFTAGTRSQ